MSSECRSQTVRGCSPGRQRGWTHFQLTRPNRHQLSAKTYRKPASEGLETIFVETELVTRCIPTYPDFLPDWRTNNLGWVRRETRKVEAFCPLHRYKMPTGIVDCQSIAPTPHSIPAY